MSVMLKNLSQYIEEAKPVVPRLVRTDLLEPPGELLKIPPPRPHPDRLNRKGRGTW